jgi:hypothetical protein
MRRRNPGEKRMPFCPAGGRLGVDARGGGAWRTVVTRDPTRGMAPRSRQRDKSLRELPAYGAVDFHAGKIRSRARIQRGDAARLEEHVRTYRPPNRSDHSTETSKRRLQTRFGLMAGKALPAAGMLPVGLKNGEELAELVARVEKLKTAGPSLISHAEAVAMQADRDRGKATEAEKLFQQVVRELDERRAHLKDLHALGDRSHDDRLQEEIASRVRDLQELDGIIKMQKEKAASAWKAP